MASVVARLFETGEIVEFDEAAALPRGLFDALIQGEILESIDDRVRSSIRLTAWEGFIVAHDDSDPLKIRADTVAGINPTTRTLAALTVRRPIDRALDIGTGCGAHALLASRHADEVVATDVNPRALWFTELNAAMNDVTNITCVEGSLFDPVQGEIFDLVVGNLPFVISPDAAYTFRDGGLPADEISRRAVEGAAAILAPGGYAHLLCNWVIEPDTPWSVRPLKWLSSVEVSAWVMHHSNEPIREYAEKWNRALLRDRPDEYLDTVERWVGYLDGIGAAAVANGAIALHADGIRTRRIDQMTARPQGRGGEQTERVFAYGTLAEPEELLDAVVSLVAPHGFHQVLRYEEDEYGVADATLVLDDTTGVVGLVEPTVAHVLLRLDGQRTLRDVIAQASEDAGLVQSELVEASLRAFGELASRGIVEVRWPV